MEIVSQEQSQDKLSPGDFLKYSVFMSLLPEALSAVDRSFSWSHMGLGITCFFSKEQSAAMNFCKNYFQPFFSTYRTVKPLDIVFINTPETYKNAQHNIWWNPEPEAWFIPHDFSKQRGFVVVQRDFVAWIDSQCRVVYVMTPEMSWKTTDSLDNLFTILFSLRGLEVQMIPIHSAMVEYEGKAFVFFGESGAGKSTLADFCFHEMGLNVMATDQGYLMLENGKVYAQSSTRKNPEFPRSHPSFLTDKREVGGLIHLVQKGTFEVVSPTNNEFLKEFIRQTLIYRAPFENQQNYLQLCAQIADGVCFRRQLSYPKGQNFWAKLLDNRGEHVVER